VRGLAGDSPAGAAGVARDAPARPPQRAEMRGAASRLRGRRERRGKRRGIARRFG